MADEDEPGREPSPGLEDIATPARGTEVPRRRGRHVGDPADAPRVTRPGPRRAAHAAAPADDPAPVLPRSPDESDLGWGRADEDGDEWLRRQVPPHW